MSRHHKNQIGLGIIVIFLLCFVERALSEVLEDLSCRPFFLFFFMNKKANCSTLLSVCVIVREGSGCHLKAV